MHQKCELGEKVIIWRGTHFGHDAIVVDSYPGGSQTAPTVDYNVRLCGYAERTTTAHECDLRPYVEVKETWWAANALDYLIICWSVAVWFFGYAYGASH